MHLEIRLLPKDYQTVTALRNALKLKNYYYSIDTPDGVNLTDLNLTHETIEACNPT